MLTVNLRLSKAILSSLKALSYDIPYHHFCVLNIISVNSTFKRYVRFVSTNATSYFWWVVCFNSTTMTAEGHCPDLLVMLTVPASRITPDRHRVADMTGLPMEDIVSVLHEISVMKGTDVGFQMERFRYTWIGTGEYYVSEYSDRWQSKTL